MEDERQYSGTWCLGQVTYVVKRQECVRRCVNHFRLFYLKFRVTKHRCYVNRYVAVSPLFLALLTRHYRHYLSQACQSGKCITETTNIFRVGITVSCVPHCYFMGHRLRRCRLILKKRTATLWWPVLR